MRWRVSDQEAPGSSVLWGPLRELGLAEKGRSVRPVWQDGEGRGILETLGGKNRTPREKEGAPADSRPQCSGPKVRG